MSKFIIGFISITFLVLSYWELHPALHDRFIESATITKVEVYKSTTLKVKLSSGKIIDIDGPFSKVGERVSLSCFKGGLSKKVYCDYTFSPNPDNK